MDNLIKMAKIAILVLQLKHDGISTEMILSGLASAIDMLIKNDNLDHKETWGRLYTTSRLINELS